MCRYGVVLLCKISENFREYKLFKRCANGHTHIGPWAVGQNYFVSWHPYRKHLVYGLFERYIGILLPKKSSHAKNLPDTEKTGDL